MVATVTKQGCSQSLFKFAWSREQSSLSQTTMRIATCSNSALLLAEQYELSSEGVSEPVLTLDSIDSSENSPDECPSRTTEAQHEFGMHCVAVQLVLACLFI